MSLLFLNQVKVRSKLTLGFALVLLLTLFIAISAWWSLDSLSESTKQFNQVDEIEAISSSLEHAVLDYRLSGSVEAREQVSVLLKRMDATMQDALIGFTSGPAAQLAEQLRAINGDYSLAFNELTASMEKRAQYTAQQAQSGAQVVATFEELHRNLVDNQPFDLETSLKLFSWTLENYRDVLLGRLQMVRYEHQRHDLELQRNGEALARKVLDNVSRMSESFNHQDARLVAGREALTQYLAAYDEVKEAFGAEDHAVERMMRTNERLYQLTEQLHELLGEEQAAQLNSARITLLVASIVAVVLSVLIAQLITLQVVTPLRETLANADRIAEGDLTERDYVRRADEFGELEGRMAVMRSSLRSLIISIDGSANQIASAAEELSAVTTQTSQGAQRQLNEASIAGQGMQEMAATVQDVAQNAEQASVAADNADQEAQNVARLAGKTLEQIGALTAQVERSMQVMQDLQQESEKIGSVLDVIKSVAEQTNLLALNAAIEAARAGEQGRGFAVVADEVRALAQRTQHSAQEIEALIGGLQTGTQQAVEAMSMGREMSVRTVEMGQTTGTSIEVITQMVSDIQGMNRQIATAADQQTSVVNELTRGMLTVQEVSEQTAAASDQTAAASQELARLGAELQAQIRRFTV